MIFATKSSLLGRNVRHFRSLSRPRDFFPRRNAPPGIASSCAISAREPGRSALICERDRSGLAPSRRSRLPGGGYRLAEPMLERARPKSEEPRRDISFRIGDAEIPWSRTTIMTSSVNASRWTLVDPAAAFREWLRRPQARRRLLVVDGDFVNSTRLERFFSSLTPGAACRPSQTRGAITAREMLETHRSILARVHSRKERAPRRRRIACGPPVRPDITVDTDLGEIHRMQAKNWNLFQGLRAEASIALLSAQSKPGSDAGPTRLRAAAGQFSTLEASTCGALSLREAATAIVVQQLVPTHVSGVANG